MDLGLRWPCHKGTLLQYRFEWTAYAERSAQRVWWFLAERQPVAWLSIDSELDARQVGGRHRGRERICMLRGARPVVARRTEANSYRQEDRLAHESADA